LVDGKDFFLSPATPEEVRQINALAGRVTPSTTVSECKLIADEGFQIILASVNRAAASEIRLTVADLARNLTAAQLGEALRVVTRISSRERPN
jgi:hypothetical protein